MSVIKRIIFLWLYMPFVLVGQNLKTSFVFVPQITTALPNYKWSLQNKIQNCGGAKAIGFGASTGFVLSYKGITTTINVNYLTNGTDFQNLSASETLLSNSERQKTIIDTLTPFFYSKNWHIINTTLSIGYCFTIKKFSATILSGIGFATVFTPKIDYTLNKTLQEWQSNDVIEQSKIVYSNRILPKANVVLVFLHQIALGYQLPHDLSLIANIGFSHTAKSNVYFADSNKTNYRGTINNFSFGIGIQKGIALKSRKTN